MGNSRATILALTATVSEAVSIPVIASGGVGNLDHLFDGFVRGKADAVLAASIFHFRTHTIPRRKPIFVRREWRFDNGCRAIEIRCAGVDSGGRAGLA